MQNQQGQTGGAMPQVERASAGDLAKPQAGMAPKGGNQALKAELRRGSEAMAKTLYGPVGDKVMAMLKEQEKVGSAAKAVVMSVTQVAKKIQLPERVIPALAALTVDEVVSLANEGMGMEFSDKEAKQVLMTSMEMILDVYGGDKPQRRMEIASERSPEELKKAEQTFKETLNA